MRTLRDRVAVVTGAGSGIGRGLALAFAREGARLAIQDVSAERVDAVAGELQRLGVDVLIDTFDVANPDAMQAFADRVRDEQGGAHVLVNNAGVSVSGTFAELTLEDWEWIVGINLWGVVHGSRAFLPQLVDQDEGHLVNISSIFGVIGVPKQSAYCATKFAVRGLSESICVELADTNVGVTCVHPGAVATRIAIDSRHHLPGRDVRRAEKVIARGMKPERAAEHIVAAIKDERRRLVLGRDAQWIDRLARTMPTRYRDLVRRYTSRLER